MSLFLTKHGTVTQYQDMILCHHQCLYVMFLFIASQIWVVFLRNANFFRKSIFLQHSLGTGQLQIGGVPSHGHFDGFGKSFEDGLYLMVLILSFRLNVQVTPGGV